MKKETALQVTPKGMSLTQEQVNLIARTIAKDATRDELTLFIGQCKRTQLDPFSRQIYFIKDKRGKVMTQISVDGFRVIAERSGFYAGQDAPFFEEKDGKIFSCSVNVYRWHNDSRYIAAVGVAYFAEYNKPGTNGYESNWDKMPRTMLSKVAESIALRKAFPNDLSGLYSPEEMNQAEPVITDTKPEPPQSPINDHSSTNMKNTEKVIEVEPAPAQEVKTVLRGTIGLDQQLKIKVLLGQLNLTSEKKDQIADKFNGIIGRTIGASKELSREEAAKIIEVLEYEIIGTKVE